MVCGMESAHKSSAGVELSSGMRIVADAERHRDIQKTGGANKVLPPKPCKKKKPMPNSSNVVALLVGTPPPPRPKLLA